MMEQAETWGWLLIAAALISLSLQVMHWRRGRIGAAQAATAVLARSGFLLLGVIYVAGLVERWPRAPLLGLAIVGVGIFLHLTVNVIRNIRRRDEA